MDTSETPLRIARDIEDFSVGGSCSENDMDEEEEEADLDVHHPPSAVVFARDRPSSDFSTSLLSDDEMNRTKGKSGVVTLANISSSDSSRGSKVSNGSVTTPTLANGFISRSINGTRTSNC